MKKISLFLVSLLLFLEVSAQDKRYVSLSLGIAIPKGEFASTDLYENGGFAKTGANFDVGFSYLLKPDFAIGVVLRAQTHGLDAQSMSDQLQTSNMVTAGNWSMIAFMAGWNASLPITEKLEFDFSMVGGIANFYNPELRISYLSPGGDWKVIVGQGSTFSPAVLFGIGFKYDIAARTFLLMKGDLLVSKAEFDNLKFISTYPSATTLFGTSLEQKITTVSVNVGVGFRF